MSQISSYRTKIDTVVPAPLPALGQGQNNGGWIKKKKAPGAPFGWGEVEPRGAYGTTDQGWIAVVDLSASSACLALICNCATSWDNPLISCAITCSMAFLTTSALKPIAAIVVGLHVELGPRNL